MSKDIKNKNKMPPNIETKAKKPINMTSFRVFGEELDPNKIVPYALRARVKGLGIPSAMKICEKLGITTKRVKDLKEEDVLNIQNTARELGYETGSDRNRTEMMRIGRLRSIRCRRGERPRLGLPIRGRTRSNGNTAYRLRGR